MRGDRLGTGRGVQLETDLGDAEPRRDVLGELQRVVEVGHVERDREPVAHVDRMSSVAVGLSSQSSDQVAHAANVVRGAPPRISSTIRSGARVGERRGADADRGRAREQHLIVILAGADPEQRD